MMEYPSSDSPRCGFIKVFPYSICVRPEAGHCCIKYSPTTDTNAFTLGITSAVMTGTNCPEDYISKYRSLFYNIGMPKIFCILLGIDGVSHECTLSVAPTLGNKFCGLFAAVPSYGGTAAVPYVCGKQRDNR